MAGRGAKAWPNASLAQQREMQVTRTCLDAVEVGARGEHMGAASTASFSAAHSRSSTRECRCSTRRADLGRAEIQCAFTYNLEASVRIANVRECS